MFWSFGSVFLSYLICKTHRFENLNIIKYFGKSPLFFILRYFVLDSVAFIQSPLPKLNPSLGLKLSFLAHRTINAPPISSSQKNSAARLDPWEDFVKSSLLTFHIFFFFYLFFSMPFYNFVFLILLSFLFLSHLGDRSTLNNKSLSNSFVIK